MFGVQSKKFLAVLNSEAVARIRIPNIELGSNAA